MCSCAGNSGSDSVCKCGKKVTLEDLRGDSTAINRSFNLLWDVAKVNTKNNEEAQMFMTHSILKELISRSVRKAKPKEHLVSWVRKKNRVHKKNPRVLIEQAGAELPTVFKKKIVVELQGSDVKLVIQKALTKTDLDASCNRLSIPSKKISVEFLTQEEQENIVQKKQDNLHFQGMKVSLIEPSLKESSIWLKKWNVGKSMSYVLSSPWISVATKNKLKVDDVIQLWSFRVNGSLCFSLIKLNN